MSNTLIATSTLFLPSTPEEESRSICPLLPSPTVEFTHPLAISTSPDTLEIDVSGISPTSVNTEISCLPPPSEQPSTPDATKDTEECKGSSSSSSCSVIQDGHIELLNSHHYLTLNDDTGRHDGLKLPPSQLHYSFVGWNWPLIRRCCFWGVMSITVALICIIISFLSHIPSTCMPNRAWYQGSTFYQIFPPSFQDTDGNGIGDIKGIIARIPYLDGIGVRAIRLSYIFHTDHYPEYFDRVQNLTSIDPILGSYNDFRDLAKKLHSKNMTLILDLPLFPVFGELKIQHFTDEVLPIPSSLNHVIVENHILPNSTRENKVLMKRGVITDILIFWMNLGVDGFYLQGLENFITDPMFENQLLEWRKELNSYNDQFKKILICSNELLTTVEGLIISPESEDKMATIMRVMDLIDIPLDPFIKGVDSVGRQIEAILNSDIYKNIENPWPYWTLGSVLWGPRLANRATFHNLTTVANILTIILPGSDGILYGDEIGLKNLNDPDEERSDLSHAHHLTPMQWKGRDNRDFTRKDMLPWLPISANIMDGHENELITSTTSLRDSTPTLYMKGIFREKHLLSNTAIRYNDAELITIERNYPRRNTFLFIANLGKKSISKDLSNIYYGGTVVLNENGPCFVYRTFKETTLDPGQFMLVKLDR